MKKFFYVLGALIILSGITLLCYPSFANWMNKRYEYKEISNYKSSVDSMDNSQMKKELHMALAYNRSLPISFPADPFTGKNETDVSNTKFADFDMVQKGAMIGYVEIPSINVYLPIYYGTDENTLQKGAGLVENTSLPVGGKGTHAVISAHTGLASKKMFTDLPEVKKGELFFIHVLNMDLAYKVDQIKVVLPENTRDLMIRDGRDFVTLLTCTPFGINDHRLLVRGSRTDYDFSKDSNKSGILSAARHKGMYFWIAVLAVLLAVIFVLSIVRGVKRGKRKQ
ncbi:MAG TPA: class C sortase [Lachnospiraceae bacterium]|nr:class C sortase [Lachnospiraceae bacterium]